MRINKSSQLYRRSSLQMRKFYRQADYKLFTGGGRAYAGPGGLGIPFTAFWGCRAYSSATIGNRAIQVRRASDNTTLDVVTLPNGQLDYGSIAAFGVGTTLTLSVWYDQTGNGLDLPFYFDHFGDGMRHEGSFTLNVINGRGVYDNTSGVNAIYAANITAAQANTNNHSFLGVYNVQTAHDFQEICGLLNDEVALVAEFVGVGSHNFISVKNEGTGRGDDTADISTATDGVWHAAVGVINQTTAQNSGIKNSFITVDSTAPVTHDLAGNPNATGEFPAFTQQKITLGGDEGTLPTTSNPLRGFIAEVGWFSSAPPAPPWTQAQAAQLIANAKTFWGF